VSKDIDETITEAEELIENLDKMAKDKMNEAEQKIKKGIVQGAIWVLVTVIIYFIWGTTWFFWLSLALNIMTAGAMLFAKVMVAKAKKRMVERDNIDDEQEDDIITTIEPKLFGKHEYSYDDGLDFEVRSVELNGRTTQLRGTIFDALNELEVQKAVTLLDNLEVLDAKARKKWMELLEEEDEEVCSYIDIHHDEYGDEVRDLVFKKLKVEKQDNRAFIKNLELGSFHITEGDEEDSVEIVMDYSLIWENGTSFTDQVLAMHFNDMLAYEMHTHDS